MVRVILISSVRPEPTSAGQIILHRHLVNQAGIDLRVLPVEPRRPGWRRFARRAIGMMGRTRLARFASDAWAFWRGGWIDAELPPPDADGTPTIVMTVAHGESCLAAMRFSQRFEIPLVTFFHDWWPDIAGVHSALRSRVEADFRLLYQSSTLVFCVSPGMREALGAHPNAIVLYPVPAAVQETDPRSVRPERRPFRVLYSGNIGDYGPMLGEALEALKDHPTIRLEVRGANPSWPEPFEHEMRNRGLWLPFAPRDTLNAWLRTADAFLIPQVFDPQQRCRMATNFPSKLAEFTGFGKPLIIWAPASASASRWAAEEDCAMVVNDSSAAVLCQALDKLSNNATEVARLSAGALRAGRECFDHEVIQRQFSQHIMKLVRYPAGDE
jgi:glycosyltransferase involved in cell wall biosynthesis